MTGSRLVASTVLGYAFWSAHMPSHIGRPVSRDTPPIYRTKFLITMMY